MMRIALSLAASVALSSATGALAAPRYAPSNLLHSGYHDDQVTPGTWFVSGVTVGQDGATAIALYRAAALVDAAGAQELRITKQFITQRHSLYGGPVQKETALLKVVAVRSAADRDLCEMKKSERCVTVRTAMLMAQYGPLLGQPTVPTSAPTATSATTSSPAPALPATDAYGRPVSAYEAGRAAARAAMAAGDPGED